ncbi:MAG: hypothetical protein JRE64_00790 [Deltaproteobacteria bacterium]|nr:hypothetical protein [Deltaproteobacteria bacterium]
MRYFKIETLGDDQDRKLAFINEPPEGIGLHSYRMAEGKPVEEYYPEDAKIYLQSKSPGLRLSSFIGNTLSYLIVNSEMKDVIIEYSDQGDCEIEILPFTLYNHKKRVYSKDYWIINPIGSFDCVNRKDSDIVYMDEGDHKGEIVVVKIYVFDVRKLENAPHIFRVPENLRRYFISESLGRAFYEKNFSNVLLTEITLTES